MHNSSSIVIGMKHNGRYKFSLKIPDHGLNRRMHHVSLLLLHQSLHKHYECPPESARYYFQNLPTMSRNLQRNHCICYLLLYKLYNISWTLLKRSISSKMCPPARVLNLESTQGYGPPMGRSLCAVVPCVLYKSKHYTTRGSNQSERLRFFFYKLRFARRCVK